MNAHPPHHLFRPEVARARGQRLHGEVILRQPLHVHAIIWLLVAIAVAGLAWLNWGQYSRTELARGVLVTTLPSAKIVAIKPGVITRLNVREGQVVRSGTVLAFVQLEQPAHTGTSVTQVSAQAVKEQRALAGQRIGYARERAAAEQQRVAAMRASLDSQRRGIEQQIALQSQIVATQEQSLDSLSGVIEKGFVSRVERDKRLQALLVAKQQLVQSLTQRDALASQSRQLAAELGKIQAELGTEHATVLTGLEQLAERYAASEAERAYAIVAPIGGRVTALQATIGSTVDVRMPIMVIVPEGGPLTAHVYAPTRSVGFVKPGQEVRLLYDAYPYQRFGSFTGKVASVSRTAIDPRELTVPLKLDESVYRIEVTPNAQAVEAFGKSHALQPGMTLSANLILDRRSFADWLLEPLRAVWRRNQ